MTSLISLTLGAGLDICTHCTAVLERYREKEERGERERERRKKGEREVKEIGEESGRGNKEERERREERGNKEEREREERGRREKRAFIFLPPLSLYIIHPIKLMNNQPIN